MATTATIPINRPIVGVIHQPQRSVVDMSTVPIQVAAVPVPAAGPGPGPIPISAAAILITPTSAANARQILHAERARRRKDRLSTEAGAGAGAGGGAGESSRSLSRQGLMSNRIQQERSQGCNRFMILALSAALICFCIIDLTIHHSISSIIVNILVLICALAGFSISQYSDVDGTLTFLLLWGFSLAFLGQSIYLIYSTATATEALLITVFIWKLLIMFVMLTSLCFLCQLYQQLLLFDEERLALLDMIVTPIAIEPDIIESEEDIEGNNEPKSNVTAPAQSTTTTTTNPTSASASAAAPAAPTSTTSAPTTDSRRSSSSNSGTGSRSDFEVV